MEAILVDNSILCYECTGSLFAERDHNHIVIGNLKTITTNKVHKRFSKGPEYWGNRTSDYEKANESVVAGIKSYF